MKRREGATGNDRRGASLLMVIIFGAMFITVLTAVTEYTIAHLTYSHERIDREFALDIAEAGANYYRWHLAHAPSDYRDGTLVAGPYVHDYVAADGTVIGQYSLDITPPAVGSTIVTVTSTGWLNRRPSLKRVVEMQLGIPSFSRFAVVANDNMRFGEGTVVYGPIHSNKGIRFDGEAHNLVTSSVTTYNDPDHSGVDEFGVHTHVRVPPATGIDSAGLSSEAPPSTMSPRTDVFMAGRATGVSTIDFSGITVNLASSKTNAISGGAYFAPSSAQGYHVHFNADDTFDVRKVTVQQQCGYRTQGTSDPFTNFGSPYSIQTESDFTWNGRSSLGIPMPANGIIFVEDDVWVDGQIDGARVTVVAGREPLASGTATIIVNNDLKYSNYDGTDSIGLIAQTDVSVGFYSADVLQIDAALIAQNGRAGRYYYSPNPLGTTEEYSPAGCGDYVHRNTLTLNGSIATNNRYGFAYTDGTGYNVRNLNFDNNLVYGPPPSFPTTGQYSLLLWEEK